MRTFKRKRGFFTLAQNGETDYLRLAYGLALSLKATQSEPYLTVGVTPGMDVPKKYRAVFDEVIEIPWLDESAASTWKLENEWKAFHMTPYEETIKLDADMLFLDSIDAWWSVLAQQDVWVSTCARNFRGEVMTSDAYRKVFTSGGLPNVYTAFMYFKATDVALELFKTAEAIYHDWQRYYNAFLQPPVPNHVSTDLVFALALMLGDIVDECTRPGDFPSFVHFKTRAVAEAGPEFSEDMTKHVPVYFTSDLECKIGRHRQLYPLHYHVKDFLTDEIIGYYEKKCL